MRRHPIKAHVNAAYWRGRHVVYRLYDGDQLLYVGRSINLADRLSYHRQNASWFRHVTRARFQVFRTAEECDQAERSAIRGEAPQFNQVHADRAPREWTAENQAHLEKHLELIDAGLDTAQRCEALAAWARVYFAEQ